MTFTSNQIAKVSGVSLRRLQWMDEQGIVSPAKSANEKRRLYSAEDLRAVLLVAALRRYGFAPKRIRAVVSCLREGHSPARTLYEDGRGWLLFGGAIAYVLPGALEALRYAESMGVRVAVVDLERIDMAVQAAVRSNNQPKGA